MIDACFLLSQIFEICCYGNMIELGKSENICVKNRMTDFISRNEELLKTIVEGAANGKLPICKPGRKFMFQIWGFIVTVL